MTPKKFVTIMAGILMGSFVSVLLIPLWNLIKYWDDGFVGGIYPILILSAPFNIFLILSYFLIKGSNIIRWIMLFLLLPVISGMIFLGIKTLTHNAIGISIYFFSLGTIQLGCIIALFMPNAQNHFQPPITQIIIKQKSSTLTNLSTGGLIWSGLMIYYCVWAPSTPTGKIIYDGMGDIMLGIIFLLAFILLLTNLALFAHSIIQHK